MGGRGGGGELGGVGKAGRGGRELDKELMIFNCYQRPLRINMQCL